MQSSRNQSYELIVIGLGLVGSSTLYEAAKILSKTASSSSPTLFGRKPLVLGIEQYEIAHDQGSSHGESRITRQAIGEGEDYVSLGIRSQDKLRELKSKTNNKFGTVCYEENSGVLIVGSTHPDSKFHGTQGFLQTTQEIATQYQIPHINYATQKDLSKDFTQFNFKEHEGGYLEKTMGIMNPEACIQSQIHLAKQENAEVRTNEKVLAFNKINNGKILVLTKKNEYITNKLVITAGPWITNFIDSSFQEKLTVHRQTVFYFEVEESYREQYLIGNFHPFIWDLGNNKCVYGFPIMQKGSTDIKIGTETFFKSTTPADVDREVSDEEIQAMYENYIKPNFKGISSKCKKAFVCLYTKTPDSQFLIDYLPDFDNKVMFASTCSGHGAKHSFAIGENLAQQMIFGQSNDHILKFNLDAMNKRNGINPETEDSLIQKSAFTPS